MLLAVNHSVPYCKAWPFIHFLWMWLPPEACHNPHFR